MNKLTFWPKAAAILIAIALLFSTVGMNTQPVQAVSATTPDYVPGERIVSISIDPHPSISQDELSLSVQQLGGKIVQIAPNKDFYVVRFGSEEEAQANVNAMAAIPGVKDVSVNQYIHSVAVPKTSKQTIVPSTSSSTLSTKSYTSPMSYAPQDGDRGAQWYLDKILYQLTPDPVATGVPCIVVIDSGVDDLHPELSGKVYHGKDYIDGAGDTDGPMDPYGQGTGIAGIVAAKVNNTNGTVPNYGIAGISPLSNLYAIRVLDTNGVGTVADFTSALQDANNLTSSDCGGQTPKIYVTGFYHTDPNTDEKNAIASALNKGRLVVVPAGDYDPLPPDPNQPSNSLVGTKKTYPAAYPGTALVAVAATEQSDFRYNYSRFDTSTTVWVDIAAPGYEIYSTTLRSRDPAFDTWQGTFTSAAIVAGVAARVWAKYPSLKAGDIRNKLISTGDPTKGFLRAVKRVNLFRALGGTTRTLQGMVLDTSSGVPLSGADVTVQRSSKVVCVTVTTAQGFYTCNNMPVSSLPYTINVIASKSGYITTSQSFKFGARLFNANVPIPAEIGTASSGDWAVSLMWASFQPFEKEGTELDLWMVNPGASASDKNDDFCYSPRIGVGNTGTDANGVSGSANTNFLLSPDSYTSTSYEDARVYKTQTGKVEVWATLDDIESWYMPRIGLSKAIARIYSNNGLTKAITVPTTDTTTSGDNWFIGTIDLDTGEFVLANKIFADTNTTAVPACIRYWLK